MEEEGYSYGAIDEKDNVAEMISPYSQHNPYLYNQPFYPPPYTYNVSPFLRFTISLFPFPRSGRGREESNNKHHCLIDFFQQGEEPVAQGGRGFRSGRGRGRGIVAIKSPPQQFNSMSGSTSTIPSSGT